MIIKNSDLSNESIAALNVLIEQDINASSAFRLMRVIKELSSIVDDKLKMEKKIYDKWVEKDENGSPVVPLDVDGLPIEGSVSITDVASFTKEMEELMNFENEVNFDKMNFDDLGLLTAKVKDIMTLDFLFI
jgi:hypothetical protein